ncbi:MAG: alpha-L-fucosidase [Prevotella sp.]|nr:alpha-L-fucosidase [Prevotella sp.]
MRKLTKTMLMAAIALLPLTNFAQGNIHERSNKYEWPTDPQVVENLKKWQDLKFGVLFHWGLYAVPGIVESWSICDEDWITRDSTQTYQQYMDWYNGLADEFNPTKFDANQWATACEEAGMRYMIFTTKHHDGFCMFDSKETDFSIAKHAFRNDPRRDVLKFVLDAFREKNFTIGTYFSKPDWHSQNYWWDVYGKKGRNVNYPVKQHPNRWNAYKQFTHNQIGEILSRYGKVDILWLDGGWVRAENRGQDLDMPALANMARSHQPGLIIVDRTIHGPYENYQTPERTIPEEQLNFPWESCIPLSDDWGFVKRPRWKSPERVISTLVEIVAKGGNLVLGVGPTPDGLIQPEAVSRLQEIGKWLKTNGKAIYNTTITPRYHDGNIWFTASKDGSSLYAIYLLDENAEMPTEISWTGNVPQRGVRLVSTGKKLKAKVNGDHVTVKLPKKMKNEAFALELKMK